MEYERLLMQLGLTVKQAKVYLALLELGQAGVGAIAERSGIKRTSVYNFIGELVVLGIISQFERHGRTTYRAEPPSRLRSLLEHRLKNFDAALPSLLATYQQASRQPTKVSYYRTPAQLRRLLFAPLTERVERIDYLWARDVMPRVVDQAVLDEYKQRRIAAKIPTRVIYNARGVTQPVNARRHAEKLRQVRVAPASFNFDATVMLFGAKLAFISSRRESFGVLIESREFADSCRVMFEGLWQLSKPN